MLIRKEQILAAADRPFEDVAVPEWGAEAAVRVSTMSGADRDAYEISLMLADGKPKLENIRARLLAHTIVDEAGARVFSEEEIAALGAKSARVLDRLFEVAQRLNGIGQKELAELGKGFAAAPGGDSSTT